MNRNQSTFWHTRYTQQAQWTKGLRHHLYSHTNLISAKRVLEVGCGTGVILTELLMQTHGAAYGIDISSSHIEFTSRNLPGLPLTIGDGHSLPYRNASFDIVLCHFLLLWVVDPVKVVQEMARVTLPDGFILALAEPDYGGRIDYPPHLEIMGKWQQTALQEQGADPLLGRKLREIFHQAGLSYVEAGLLGGQWSGTPSAEEFTLEWQVLEEDMCPYKHEEGFVEFENLRKQDQAAWDQGSRVLFVPTFYAFGQVTDNK